MVLARPALLTLHWCVAVAFSTTAPNATLCLSVSIFPPSLCRHPMLWHAGPPLPSPRRSGRTQPSWCKCSTRAPMAFDCPLRSRSGALCAHVQSARMHASTHACSTRATRELPSASAIWQQHCRIVCGPGRHAGPRCADACVACGIAIQHCAHRPYAARTIGLAGALSPCGAAEEPNSGQLPSTGIQLTCALPSRAQCKCSYASESCFELQHVFLHVFLHEVTCELVSPM